MAQTHFKFLQYIVHYSIWYWLGKIFGAVNGTLIKKSEHIFWDIDIKYMELSHLGHIGCIVQLIPCSLDFCLLDLPSRLLRGRSLWSPWAKENSLGPPESSLRSVTASAAWENCVADSLAWSPSALPSPHPLYLYSDGWSVVIHQASGAGHSPVQCHSPQ